MIARVISGGQTGADQAGWMAAKAAGIATGGWMPPEFMTEAGPRMQFRVDFNAREIERDESMIYPAGGTDWGVAYKTRTRMNVRDCDAVVWFGNPHSRGGRATMREVDHYNRDHYVIINANYHGGADVPPLDEWLREYIPVDKVRVLMVAGNRESSAPGIGEWVEAYLVEVFRLLGRPTP